MNELPEDRDALCGVCYQRCGEHMGAAPHHCPNPEPRAENFYATTVWEPTVYTVEPEPAEYIYERLRREELDNQEDP